MTDLTIEQLVELAREAEIGDPFDWANIQIEEESAYRLVAMGLLEMDMSEEIMLASVCKLCVENLVLHTRLMKYER